jgi:alkylation response protein AidB-like acyl-CoA dehydrogenase
LKDSLSGCRLIKDVRAELDFAMIFIKSQAEMKEQFPKFVRQLAPAGMLWVTWPKKTSGVVPDLNENDVRRVGLTAGLVDVKVCAVNEVWSGLKFVRRLKDRA